MKAVLMSIHPKWCEKIFNGGKTIEVRRREPTLTTPFTVYVYQTKHKGKSIVSDVLNSVYAGGKVIGSFVCDRIIEMKYNFCDHPEIGYPQGDDCGDSWWEWNDEDDKTCLTDKELTTYARRLRALYGWHITEPKLFDKPRELGEFWLYNDELNKRYEHDENFCCYDGTDENGEATTDCDGENINNCYLCWEKWSGWCHKLTRPPQSWCYVEEI